MSCEWAWQALQPEGVAQIGFEPGAWKMLREPRVLSEPESPHDAVALYLKDGATKAVIERDDNILGAAGREEQKESLRAAGLKELKYWAGFKAISRSTRYTSNTLMDAKWLDKWK